MKTPRIVLLVSILLFALPAVSSFAVLDTTVEECSRRYGEPVSIPYTFEYRGQPRTIYTYHWKGIFVRAAFVGTNDTDLRCISLEYERIRSAGRTGENKMTGAEIENILALNANGSPWKRVRRGWIRSDGEGFVYEFNFRIESVGTRENVRMNSLLVFEEDFAPEIAASIKAAGLPSE
jgi:hypothetical protein